MFFVFFHFIQRSAQNINGLENDFNSFTDSRKQISLLEENLQSLEKRLREEIKSTETYHLNKISALQTDMENQQHKYEEHVEKLITDYEKQIERLRLNYEHDLEALKNDQRSTIESIRQAKLFEFAAVQESGSYLHTLKSASDNLEHATDNLQSMRTNIDATIERIHAEKDVQLEVKEKRLNGKKKDSAAFFSYFFSIKFDEIMILQSNKKASKKRLRELKKNVLV